MILLFFIVFFNIYSYQASYYNKVVKLISRNLGNDMLLRELKKVPLSKEDSLRIMFYAMQTGSPKIIINFFVKERGIDKDGVPVKSSTGNTLLHLAVLRNSFDLVKFLLDLGCDPFLENDQGKTPFDLSKEIPLMYSIFKEHIKKMQNKGEISFEDLGAFETQSDDSSANEQPTPVNNEPVNIEAEQQIVVQVEGESAQSST